MSADDPSDRFGARRPLDDVVAPQLTVEQFLHQRPRSELIFGHVRPIAPPPAGNDRMVSQLMSALLRYQRVDPDSHAWPLPEVVLDRVRWLVVNPALAVVTADRWALVRDRIWGAPNVIVEVIDKWRARRTRAHRIRWYQQYGVQECWLLDSRVQRVDVVDFRRSSVPHIYNADDEFVSVVLKGFKMRVADLYGRDLRGNP